MNENNDDGYDDERENPRPAALPHEVGYQKPPHHGRFVKGRSGNPKGRPKKKPAPTSALDASVVLAVKGVSMRE